MKNLLLLLLAVYFYSNPVAAAASDVNSTLHFTMQYSKCPGSEPDLSRQLQVTQWIFVTTDKVTGLIEGVLNAEYDRNKKYYWEITPALRPYLFRNDPTKELHLAAFVETARNDKMTGVDNQIFYGYDPEHAWMKRPSAAYVDLGTTPFRYGHLSFTLTRKKENSKAEKIFEAKESSDCNHDNYEAWVANHGIYRVRKNDKGELYFSNLYYWPRTGMIFT